MRSLAWCPQCGQVMTEYSINSATYNRPFLALGPPKEYAKACSNYKVK
jgi:hypothetical protein